MAISDRDKKLIYLLLTAIVICLPYFFYIKDKHIETENLKQSNEVLKDRYEELEAMNANREQYIKDTEQNIKDMEKIIKKYPSDVVQAQYLTFLLHEEFAAPETQIMLSAEDGEDEEAVILVDKNRIWFDGMHFGQNMIEPIASEELDTGYMAVTNSSTLQFEVYYPAMLFLLADLRDMDQKGYPMSYSGLKLEFDDQTGQITGEMVLDQYAVSGQENKPAPKPDFGEFGIDALGIRGNKYDVINDPNGIFGPTEDEKGFADLIREADVTVRARTVDGEDAEEGEAADAEDDNED